MRKLDANELRTVDAGGISHSSEGLAITTSSIKLVINLFQHGFKGITLCKNTPSDALVMAYKSTHFNNAIFVWGITEYGEFIKFADFGLLFGGENSDVSIYNEVPKLY